MHSFQDNTGHALSIPGETWAGTVSGEHRSFPLFWVSDRRTLEVVGAILAGRLTTVTVRASYSIAWLRAEYAILPENLAIQPRQ